MILCSPQYGLLPNSSAGGEVYDEKILKGLAEKGIIVEIILPYGKSYDTTQRNWNVHRLHLPFIHYSYLFNLAIIPQLIAIYKKTNFKVLRIHSPYYVGIGAWIFKKLFAPDIKLAVTYFHFECKFLFKLIDKIFIRKWDYLITISLATEKVLTERYGISKEKIAMAYPGISGEHIFRPKNEEILEKYNLINKFVVVFCGMLIKRKNVKFLIELVKLSPLQDLSLLVIGDGPERKFLENIAEKEGVTPKVVFTGFLPRKDKIAAIQSSDVFVFPSLMEGFGLSPVEAMACGIPTIVSNRGSLPEVVGDGAIVLPLEVGLWLKIIGELAKKKGLCAKWSNKALAHAKKFQWQTTVDEVFKVYESLDMLPYAKKEPKVHIFYQIRNTPWGGGNQFLKALKSEFIDKNVYSENPEDADIIIFNSFDHLDKIISFKKRYPSKKFIHRVDGPIYLVRGKDRMIDRLIFMVNESIADATVFQSQWSLEKSMEQGMRPNNFETIISNAPDPHLFNRQDKLPFFNNRKIKLISVSWSNNWNKGFKYYDYLDKNLDWSTYEMTFIGRSPIKFSHIKMAGQLVSAEIAQLLKQHDIFITASKDEPCSNALIEALSCGLPSLVVDSGGNPKLIGKGGELFSHAEEIPFKLEQIINNYDQYQEAMPKYAMSEVAEKYYDFVKLVEVGTFQKSYRRKYLTCGMRFRIKAVEICCHLERVLRKISKS